MVEAEKGTDAWQEWVASFAAAASAALPFIIALAPLVLGQIAVFGPPAVDELTKFLKSIGWIK